MGDRGNIRVIGNMGGAIYLYTHWGGSQLENDLKEALIKGRDRWDDDAYLTRTIFCAMIPKEQHDEITGFGITTYQTDNDHDIVEVGMIDKTVTIGLDKWTFEEFVNRGASS